MDTKTFKLAINADKKNRKKGKLILEGELNLKNIREIKNLVSDHIQGIDNLEIHLRNIETIDITFIQLLVSLKKTLGKVIIDGELPLSPAKILENAGLKHIIDTNIISN